MCFVSHTRTFHEHVCSQWGSAVLLSHISCVQAPGSSLSALSTACGRVLAPGFLGSRQGASWSRTRFSTPSLSGNCSRKLCIPDASESLLSTPQSTCQQFPASPVPGNVHSGEQVTATRSPRSQPRSQRRLCVSRQVRD